MGRGVSAGGGQSSLGYLFGDGGAPKPLANNAEAAVNQVQVTDKPPQKPTAVGPSVDVIKQTPAGVQGSTQNNYFRADGPNSGNFITDRTSTKVHASPGGVSSLGYMFGDGGK